MVVTIAGNVAQFLTEEQKNALAKALEPAADLDPDTSVPVDVSTFTASCSYHSSTWQKYSLNRKDWS